jgi:DNA invertase Pin-like site-specific DNA recombinase
MRSKLSPRRAVGVVRVSRRGDRGGETYVTEAEQRQRITDVCKRDDLELVEVFTETNVSGGAPLERRVGLLPAVELVEEGEASVVVVAYFDRLVRSLRVQTEVVERIEKAGGSILAVDIGEVRADTAARWLTTTMLGMIAEYYRRSSGERTKDAKQRAIDRGVPPFANIPPGYRRREDRTLEPDPATADVAAEAFELRAEGATVMEVRAFLREHGIERSFHGVQSMLSSPIYLGELHFGAFTPNTTSHKGIVDPRTFERVQTMRSLRGKRPQSERLLSRLEVLRCGTCGARMVVGTVRYGQYFMYRCPPVGDCPRRVTISAPIAEATVMEAAIKLLRGIRGTASVGRKVAEAVRVFENADSELDATLRTFVALEAEPGARDRLLQLRAARDAARDRLARLQAAAGPALTVTMSNWDDLTLAEQRALIRATIEQAKVLPATPTLRGRDRIVIHSR